MDQERRQSIALMRYSVIAPLITGLSDEYDSLEAFYRNASAKGVTHPDGTLKHYAPGTIEKWYRNYKQHGFDALVPTGRADLGKTDVYLSKTFFGRCHQYCRCIG